MYVDEGVNTVVDKVLILMMNIVLIIMMIIEFISCLLSNKN